MEAVKVGGERFPLFLFPSLVRDLHHVCSSELIGGLASLDPGTRAAVARLATYHRRQCPLVDGAPWRDDRFNLRIPPLSETIDRPMAVEGRELKRDRLLLLAALLRFIDACDVQADRVVNEHYAKARLTRTDAEIRVYLERLRRLAEAAGSARVPYAEVLLEILNRVEGALDTWEDTEPSKATRKQLRADIVGHAVDAMKAGSVAPGWLEALGLADGILIQRTGWAD